jgi:hypothetical protein
MDLDFAKSIKLNPLECMVLDFAATLITRRNRRRPPQKKRSLPPLWRVSHPGFLGCFQPGPTSSRFPNLLPSVTVVCPPVSARLTVSPTSSRSGQSRHTARHMGLLFCSPQPLLPPNPYSWLRAHHCLLPVTETRNGNAILAGKGGCFAKDAAQ